MRCEAKRLKQMLALALLQRDRSGSQARRAAQNGQMQQLDGAQSHKSRQSGSSTLNLRSTLPAAFAGTPGLNSKRTRFTTDRTGVLSDCFPRSLAVGAENAARHD